MKFLKGLVLVFALSGSLTSHGQQTGLFVAFQTGSPFRIMDNEEAPILMNLNIGAEQTVIDKLSISLSYRKVFYLVGKSNNSMQKIMYDNYGWNYGYTEDYDSYAIDFESRYFIDEPDDDGWYVSSGISFQHLTMNLDIFSVMPYNLYQPPGQQVLPYGKFKDEMNIYPLTIKIGARHTGDVLVYDWFIGMSYHIGAAGIHRVYEDRLDYFDFKTFSFPIGVKLGFKF